MNAVILCTYKLPFEHATCVIHKSLKCEYNTFWELDSGSSPPSLSFHVQCCITPVDYPVLFIAMATLV